jgi:hypothetical protein
MRDVAEPEIGTLQSPTQLRLIHSEFAPLERERAVPRVGSLRQAAGGIEPDDPDRYIPLPLHDRRVMFHGDEPVAGRPPRTRWR